MNLLTGRFGFPIFYSLVCLIRPVSVASPEGEASEPLRISYAPEVAFRNEETAFVFKGPPESEIQISLGQTYHSALRCKTKPVEWRPTFDKETILNVVSQDQTVKFGVICADGKTELREKDGLLWGPDYPVILLPDHRKPPKIDRSWESIRLIGDLFKSDEQLAQPLVVGNEDSVKIHAHWIRKISFKHPRALRSKASLLPIHGRIAAATQLAVEKKEPVFLIVDLGLEDLERGMAPDQWIMKLHFLLQSIESKRTLQGGLLLCPPISERQREQYDHIINPLRVIADCYQIRFVDRRLPAAEWQARVIHHVGKEVKLP